MENFDFDPTTGLNDASEYPTKPASEAAARAQFQGLLDQLKDYINDLKAGVETSEEPSGAQMVGSKDIADVGGSTVFEQMVDLKDQIDGVTLGQIPPGSLTADKVADGTLTADKVADGTLTADKVAFGVVRGGGAIINGNFDVWQRGTSQTSAGYGSDDRWLNIYGGTTTSHSKQTFSNGQTEVPNNPVSFSETVVVSSVGAGNWAMKVQKIEDVRTFSGEIITLSFWAKADSNKNIAIDCEQYFGSGGSTSVNEIGAQKFAVTTSWTKFTATINVPSILGKTIGDNNAFVLHFWFDAGSDFDSRTDSLGQQSGTFDIAQVKLEKGSVATPFVPKTFAEELRDCQRYCWTPNGSSVRAVPFQVYTDGMRFAIPIPEDMRTHPSIIGTQNTDIIIYSPNGTPLTGFSFVAYRASGSASIFATKTAHGLTDGFIQINASSGFDAEL